MRWQECSKRDERLRFVAVLVRMICFLPLGAGARTKRQGTALRPQRPQVRITVARRLQGDCTPAIRGSRYLLTISDFASRYLLSCDALATTKAQYAFTVFDRALMAFGSPGAIRTDNGAPFASAGPCST